MLGTTVATRETLLEGEQLLVLGVSSPAKKSSSQVEHLQAAEGAGKSSMALWQLLPLEQAPGEQAPSCLPWPLPLAGEDRFFSKTPSS